MGRAPCCDKANVKRGPWSPEEDSKLKAFIEQHGTGGNWIALPQKIGLKRCGKSCRLRWLNYLRPNIKHGGFSEEEDNIICNLYISIGSRWSIIAAQLPGRTDNDIKNYWNTRLKKKLLGKQRKEQHARRSTLKAAQEMKKGIISGNFMTTTPAADHHNIIGTQNVYHPGPSSMPSNLLGSSPYQNQVLVDPPPCLNDHTSIRKLLIRLGGRFSDDNNNNVHDHYQPNGGEDIKNLGCTHDDDDEQNFYGNPSSMDDWFPMNSIPCCDDDQLLMMSNDQLIISDHDVDGVAMNHMLQQQAGVVLNSFDEQLDEMVCSANNKVDQGSSSSSELFYGRDGSMANDNNNQSSTSTSTTNWVDMCSFVYPPTVTNYEVSQQRILHGYTTFQAPKQLDH